MKTKISILQKVMLLGLIIFTYSCNNDGFNLNAQETGSYTDSRDGRTYKTVKIGNQWVMAENFAYKPKYGNYWAYGNDTSNIAIYGYLYDWEIAQNIAPQGWHLPTLDEWKILRKSLGGRADVFKYLGGTMEKVYKQMIPGGASGFNALFGGCRFDNGQFGFLGECADFWSATDGGHFFDNGPFHYIVDSKKDGIPSNIFDSKEGIAYLGSVDFSTCGKSVRLFKD